LLRILAGIVAPTSGQVEVLGVERLARTERCRVGYVSQDPALDPEMTGAEILTLLAALYGVRRSRRRERVAELAAAFGFASHLSRPVSAWSGGLRRRLHLAAGMIHDPELLLLDEPTAGLDPQGRDLLWADLDARAAGGRAVAIVTHDLAAAERHAGTVVILDRGAVVAAGTPAEILAAAGVADLAAAFHRRTGRDLTDLLPRRRGER
jgi:ABC-2 type transport system ATP-binding protein